MPKFHSDACLNTNLLRAFFFVSNQANIGFFDSDHTEIQIRPYEGRAGIF
jgi:hypothetical protein